MASYGLIEIKSNDGSQTLLSATQVDSYSPIISVTSTGVTQGSSFTYSYSGDKTFLGVATVANATEPTYAVGNDYTLSIASVETLTLYIVEGEKEPKVTITYNENVIASLGAGQTATLQCNGKKMASDIIVTAPEVAEPEVTDSPLPIEVSTADEMTALLETAEVGAIYKYTGETTDTYENGALYVVAKGGYKVSVTSTNERVFVHDTEPTDGSGTGALGEVSSGGTAEFLITTGKLYIVNPATSNLSIHNESGGVTFEEYSWSYSAPVVIYTVTGDGSTSITFGGF